VQHKLSILGSAEIEKLKASTPPPSQSESFQGYELIPATAQELMKQHRQRLMGIKDQLLRTDVDDRSSHHWRLARALCERGVPEDHAVRILHDMPSVQDKASNRDPVEYAWTTVSKAYADKPDEPQRLSPRAVPDYDGPPSDSLFKLMGRGFKPPEWGIQACWSKRGFGMMAGEAKTHKTWVAIDLALSIASGSPFLGRYEVLDRGPVLFLEAEVRARSMAYRTKLIAANKGLGFSMQGDHILARGSEPVHLWRSTHIDLSDQDTIDQVRAEVKRIGAVMVIFDPLQMMLGNKSENSSQDMRQVLTPLSELSIEMDTGVCVVHHFSKPPTDPKSNARRSGQRTSGTQFFHAWVENGMWIDYVDDENITIEREFRDMDAEGAIKVEFNIDSDADSYAVTAVEANEKRNKTKATPEPKESTTEILFRAIEYEPGLPLRVYGIRCKMSERTLRRHAAELVRSERITRRGKRWHPVKASSKT
jgi:hypothetical protein